MFIKNKPLKKHQMKLTIYTDGASRNNPGKAAIAYRIEIEGKLIEEKGEYIGITTNNQAEYKALIKALKEAKKHNPSEITHYSDSQLLIKQVTGEWKVKEEKLQELKDEILKLENGIKVRHEHVRRNNIGVTRCDELANNALDKITRK